MDRAVRGLPAPLMEVLCGVEVFPGRHCPSRQPVTFMFLSPGDGSSHLPCSVHPSSQRPHPRPLMRPRLPARGETLALRRIVAEIRCCQALWHRLLSKHRNGSHIISSEGVCQLPRAIICPGGLTCRRMVRKPGRSATSSPVSPNRPTFAKKEILSLLFIDCGSSSPNPPGTENFLAPA